jgi:hypothetical protein
VTLPDRCEALDTRAGTLSEARRFANDDDDNEGEVEDVLQYTCLDCT